MSVQTRSLLLAASMLGVVALNSSAQARPDFSGTWVYEKERSEQLGAMDIPPAERLIVTQTASELALRTEGDGWARTYVFKLDGSPSLNGSNTISAQWDGASIKLSVRQSTDDVSVESAQIWSLSADGSDMRLEGAIRLSDGTPLLAFNLVYRKQAS